MNKETEQKIMQLRIIEQSLNNLLTQKNHFESQLIEIDSALNELQSSDECYEIIANIMVKTDKSKTVEELKNKQLAIKSKVETFEKQEANLNERLQNLQKEVMEKVK